MKWLFKTLVTLAVLNVIGVVVYGMMGEQAPCFVIPWIGANAALIFLSVAKLIKGIK